MAKFGSEPHRRNTIDDYRRRSSDMVSVKPHHWTPAKIITIFMLSTLTVLVLGSIAIGGAALYYGGFETQIDTYLVMVKFNHEIYKSNMGVPRTTHFTFMETEFCKGVNVVFGRELKSCELDGLSDDSGVVVHGRLQFYRRTLESIAEHPGFSQKYIRSRLDYACYTQIVCTKPIPTPTLLPTEVKFVVQSNFTTTTTQIVGRNDTNFIKAQAAVCDGIKVQLGSLYIECYVERIETGTSGQTFIIVTVDHLLLRDNTKRDSATLTKGVYGSDQMGDELKTLVNKGGGRKVSFFSNLVLVADTVRFYE
jgi:hypothetical protein